MARPADPNPFEEEEVNPFSEPAVRAQISGQTYYSPAPFHATDWNNNGASTTKSKLSPLPPEPIDFTYDRDATLDIPLGTKDIKKREKELALWEAQLNRKEQELRRREEALARSGFVVEKKNWPPFYPIMSHNISGEIPPPAQRLMYCAFASWLGIQLCLLWNVIAVSIGLTRGAPITSWLLALVYALVGCPGSYVLWYKPLYRSMRKDSALRFGWFFLTYMFHIGFCIFVAIAPPIFNNVYSMTGILSAIIVLPQNAFVGIFYLVGFGLFSLETLLSIWILQRVYAYFRSGKSTEMGREAARGAPSAAL